MKNYLIILAVILTGLSACNNATTENSTNDTDTTVVQEIVSGVSTLPHIGSWTR